MDMIHEIYIIFMKFVEIKNAKNYRLSRKHPIQSVLRRIREAPNDQVISCQPHTFYIVVDAFLLV